MIGKSPTTADNAMKLVLWFTPILLEVCAHFLANVLPGRVRYEPDAVYARAATVFIIILGGGTSLMLLFLPSVHAHDVIRS